MTGLAAKLDFHNKTEAFVSVAVFLFFALYFAFRSGYSVGAVLLALAGLACCGASFRVFRENTNIRELSLLFLLCAALRVASDLVDGQGLRSFDVPSSMLLAIPVLWLLHRYPVRRQAYLVGLGLACVVAFVVSLRGLLLSEEGRGFTGQGIIQSGNASMLFAYLAMALSLYFYRHQRQWSLLFFLAALAGVGGSLFSGSRGGWLFAPMMLGYIAWQARRWLPPRVLFSACLYVVAGVGLVASAPSLKVQERVSIAYEETRDYFQARPLVVNEGKSAPLNALGAGSEMVETSVSLRLDMWRNGWRAFLEKPLFGWGKHGLESAFSGYHSEGLAPAAIIGTNHLHNDFFNELAARGLVGVAVYIACLLVPWRIFCSHAAVARRSDNRELQLFAFSGQLFILSILGFSFTHAFFYHNSGIILYSFLLAILMSLIHSSLGGKAGTGAVRD